MILKTGHSKLLIAAAAVAMSWTRSGPPPQPPIPSGRIVTVRAPAPADVNRTWVRQSHREDQLSKSRIVHEARAQKDAVDRSWTRGTFELPNVHAELNTRLVVDAKQTVEGNRTWTRGSFDLPTIVPELIKRPVIDAARFVEINRTWTRSTFGLPNIFAELNTRLVVQAWQFVETNRTWARGPFVLGTVTPELFNRVVVDARRFVEIDRSWTRSTFGLPSIFAELVTRTVVQARQFVDADRTWTRAPFGFEPTHPELFNHVTVQAHRFVEINRSWVQQSFNIESAIVNPELFNRLVVQAAQDSAPLFELGGFLMAGMPVLPDLENILRVVVQAEPLIDRNRSWTRTPFRLPAVHAELTSRVVVQARQFVETNRTWTYGGLRDEFTPVYAPSSRSIKIIRGKRTNESWILPAVTISDVLPELMRNIIVPPEPLFKEQARSWIRDTFDRPDEDPERFSKLVVQAHRFVEINRSWARGTFELPEILPEVQRRAIVAAEPSFYPRSLVLGQASFIEPAPAAIPPRHAKINRAEASIPRNGSWVRGSFDLAGLSLGRAIVQAEPLLQQPRSQVRDAFITDVSPELSRRPIVQAHRFVEANRTWLRSVPFPGEPIAGRVIEEAEPLTLEQPRSFMRLGVLEPGPLPHVCVVTAEAPALQGVSWLRTPAIFVAPAIRPFIQLGAEYKPDGPRSILRFMPEELPPTNRGMAVVGAPKDAAELQVFRTWTRTVQTSPALLENVVERVCRFTVLTNRDLEF